MNLKESAFAQHPTLLGTQPESPEHEQFDSALEDAKEEDGKATAEGTKALSKEPCHAQGVHSGTKGISEAQE